MSWSVRSHLPDQPLLEVTLSGQLAADEVAEAFGVLVELGEELDVWLVIANCQELQGGHTVFNLYTLIEQLATLGATDKFREALIRPTSPEAAKLVRFWEDAGVNRGLSMRTFSDRESAITWLLG